MAKNEFPIKPTQMNTILSGGVKGEGRVSGAAVDKAVAMVADIVKDLIDRASSITKEKGNITLKKEEVQLAIKQMCNVYGISPSTIGKTVKHEIQLGAVASFVDANKKTERISEDAVKVIAAFAKDLSEHIASNARKFAAHAKRTTLKESDISLVQALVPRM